MSPLARFLPENRSFMPTGASLAERKMALFQRKTAHFRPNRQADINERLSDFWRNPWKNHGFRAIYVFSRLTLAPTQATWPSALTILQSHNIGKLLWASYRWKITRRNPTRLTREFAAFLLADWQ